MKLDSKVYVAGHSGMVGSAICRLLRHQGYSNVIFRSSQELDLRNQSKVNEFFALEKPEFVFLAAAKVGGIQANHTHKADFLYDNLMIESNVIHESYQHKVAKLLFLGSSCIYPKMAEQPLKEDDLLTGALEPTNEPYAIAKIAGIKLCQSYREQYSCNFISAMPTNLYGVGDHYDLQNSHVLPALLRKIHEAKENGANEVEVWGTGTPRREFLYVDDLAEASLFLMQNYSESEIVNVGSGDEISIKDLAVLICNIVGYQGKIAWNSNKPDGTPRKWLDISKLSRMGWFRSTGLKQGIELVYQDFISKKEHYTHG